MNIISKKNEERRARRIKEEERFANEFERDFNRVIIHEPFGCIKSMSSKLTIKNNKIYDLTVTMYPTMNLTYSVDISDLLLTEDGRQFKGRTSYSRTYKNIPKAHTKVFTELKEIVESEVNKND